MESIPCKECLIYAICKNKKLIECEILINWIWYDSYNLYEVCLKKDMIIEFFNWPFIDYIYEGKISAIRVLSKKEMEAYDAQYRPPFLKPPVSTLYRPPKLQKQKDNTV